MNELYVVETFVSEKQNICSLSNNSSHISSETKEILKLFMAMFSTIQLERDNKIKDLDKKVTSIQSTTTALEKEISDVKESTDHQMSILRNEISSLKTKLITQENTHSTHLNSLSNKIDSNEQYERRDALVLSGPLVPEVSDREDCKQIIQRLLRDHTRLNLNVSDISTAHRIGKSTPGSNKRNIIFKLCRRDLVQDIFAACKTQNSAFFINTSLSILQNKILFGPRPRRRTCPSIVRACRSSMTGEVTVFVVAAGNNSATTTGTEADTLTSTNAPAASISGPAPEAIPEASSGTVSEATTSGNRRRGDGRLVINSK